MCSDEITLLVNNEVKPRVLKRFDVLRWWELFEPTGELPPFWVKKDAEFAARRDYPNHAVIVTVKPGWVSFLDTTSVQANVFRMIPYEKFAEFWEAVKTPSLWERIALDDDSV